MRARLFAYSALASLAAIAVCAHALAQPGATPPSGPPGSTAPTGTTSTPPPVFAPKPAGKVKLTMRGQHNGFVDKMDCSACHTPDGWELSAKAGASGFDHDKTGFPLRGAHNQTTCSGCHTSTSKPASTCDGCHHDPHEGRNNGPCAECHTATAWSDTNTLEQHRRTRMPLTGRHATIDCVACHKRQGERQWSDVPLDCYSCHRTSFHGSTHPVHDGSTGQAMFPRDCGRCHTPIGWSPAIVDPNALPRTAARTMAQSGDHDAFFVLTTGSHMTAECGACHPDAKRPQFARCDGCHLDVTLRTQHGGKAMSHGASACLRCHPRGAAR